MRLRLPHPLLVLIPLVLLSLGVVVGVVWMRYSRAQLVITQAHNAGARIHVEPGAPERVMDLRPEDERWQSLWTTRVESIEYDSRITLPELDLSYVAAADDLRVLEIPAAIESEVSLRPLADLKGLELLKLRGPGVTDRQMPHLGGLTRLRELDLAETGVSDVGLNELASLPNLESLTLSRCAIEVGLEPLQLSRLRLLMLDGTNVDDAGIVPLANARDLRLVYLDGTRIDDEALTLLGELPELRTLSVRNTKVTDQGIARLKECHELNRIWAEGTQVTAEGATALVKGMPKLSVLCGNGEWVYGPDAIR